MKELISRTSGANFISNWCFASRIRYVDRAHKFILCLKPSPFTSRIRLNFANLIRRDRPVKAFEIHLSLLQKNIIQ